MNSLQATSIGRTVIADCRPQELKEFVLADGELRGKELPNAMTVDVEDYFQVSAFDRQISREDWNSIPSRIASNVERILELFEQENVRATFFTLGWVSEKFPKIVRAIAAAGHEIASHGHEHSRVQTFSHKQFRRDVEGTRRRLEDVSGTAVVGYRAPSFSIGQETLWAYDVLREAGYSYSSSVFPIQHDHYGLPNAPRFPFRTSADGLLEVPMSTVAFLGRNWPCSGGGYFRLLPLKYSIWAVRRINKQEQMPAVFYFHPWEMDPDQPRIDGISMQAKFRHYLNLEKFEYRLTQMLRTFRWDRMDRIYLGHS
jgi:polysaccharide deacetylase family protein (PEP-CTERM system associated)